MKKGFNPRQANCNAYYEFLNKALQTIRRIKDVKKQRRQVEQLLEHNLDKLDDKFSQMLRSWAKAKLSTVEPEEAQTIAGPIHNFCTYIAQCPLIKPEIKWGIVITGCQVATTVFTREASRTDWLMIQNILGIAYCNQGRIAEAPRRFIFTQNQRTGQPFLPG